MTPEQQQLDVYSAEYGALLITVLEKFQNENKDMAIMSVHRQVQALLDAINDV